jgi:hypothetical protein
MNIANLNRSDCSFRIDERRCLVPGFLCTDDQVLAAQFAFTVGATRGVSRMAEQANQ